LTVRVLSRRPRAQLTLFEFVLVFLIGGVFILATVGDDRSVTNCATAIIAVGLMHRFVSWLKSKSSRRGRIIDGTPLILLKDGEWQTEVMKGMQIDREDVMAVDRAKSLKSIDEIKYVVLERNGAISIIKAD